MDFSFVLIIGFATIITSALMIFSEVTARRKLTFRPTLRLAFGISYLAGLALMQPWRITSAQEVGMSIMMLIFIMIWVAVGCVIGAVPTALAISGIRWTVGIFRKRT